jgi:hypothetical protein
MGLDTTFSIAMLAAFIWTVRVLLPRAIQSRDPLALASAVLTALLALLAWLLSGVAAGAGRL